jgi:DNA topoisomerase 2-associated protein PAT1
MAFFGLPERELPIGSLGEHHEQIAEYTWGEESYDGLADALQEARDDLNDETFGSAGPVGTCQLFSSSISSKTLAGKDFDFTNTTLPDIDYDHQLPQHHHLQDVHHGQSPRREEIPETSMILAPIEAPCSP